MTGSFPPPGARVCQAQNGADVNHRFDERRLAWIFGSSRSGSTWLLEMLGDTRRVATIDDPHLGHHLGVWRPLPLAWAAAVEPPELATLPEVKGQKPDYFFSERYRDSWAPPLRELIAGRFAAQAAAERPSGTGRPRIVVKEPGSQAAELLLSLFPGSKLIFLLRDGRDVVDSWLDAYQRGSWAQEEGAFAVAPRGRIPLIRWLASVWLFRTEAVERAFAAHERGSRLLVRYEELLSQPAAQLGRICALLELDVPPAELERIAAARNYDAVSPARRGNGRAVRLARPGGWRRNLSRTERDALLEIVGPKLERLGYRPGHRRTARLAA